MDKWHPLPVARWSDFNRRHGDRFILHYTPKHASWVNQVELFFSILQTERQLLISGADEVIRSPATIWDEFEKALKMSYENLELDARRIFHRGPRRGPVARFSPLGGRFTASEFSKSDAPGPPMIVMSSRRTISENGILPTGKAGPGTRSDPGPAE